MHKIIKNALKEESKETVLMRNERKQTIKDVLDLIDKKIDKYYNIIKELEENQKDAEYETTKCIELQDLKKEIKKFGDV